MSKYIVVERKLKDLVVDEYTKEAVDKNKLKELEEVATTFKMYGEEFENIMDKENSLRGDFIIFY